MEKIKNLLLKMGAELVDNGDDPCGQIYQLPSGVVAELDDHTGFIMLTFSCKDQERICEIFTKECVA